MSNVNILVNQLNAVDDVCCICLDDLNKEQVYELRECGHKYHTNCIFHWVRCGHSNCPYCGNNGVNNLNNLNNEDSYINYYRFNNDLYILLRQFSRKKDAPIQLKKQVDRLKILEQRLKDSSKVKKEFLLKSGKFKEIQINYTKLCRKNWNISAHIRRMKRIICTNNNITPLILIKKNYS